MQKYKNPQGNAVRVGRITLLIAIKRDLFVDILVRTGHAGEL